MHHVEATAELLEFAYEELGAGPVPAKKRKRKRELQTAFWIDPPLQKMLSLLEDKLKKSGRMASFEKRQDFLRRLVLMEFITEFCSKKRIAGMADDDSAKTLDQHYSHS